MGAKWPPVVCRAIPPISPVSNVLCMFISMTCDIECNSRMPFLIDVKEYGVSIIDCCLFRENTAVRVEKLICYTATNFWEKIIPSYWEFGRVIYLAWDRKGDPSCLHGINCWFTSTGSRRGKRRLISFFMELFVRWKIRSRNNVSFLRFVVTISC